MGLTMERTQLGCVCQREIQPVASRVLRGAIKSAGRKNRETCAGNRNRSKPAIARAFYCAKQADDKLLAGSYFHREIALINS